MKFAIHSVPRSGSTWLGEIFNSSPAVKYCFQPLFSYALKGALSPSSTRLEIDAFFEECRRTQDPFILQSDARKSGDLPQFAKNEKPEHVGYKEVRYHHILPHMLALDADIQYIFIVRSPLSVINSWLRAPKEFQSEWSADQEWKTAPKKNQGKPEEFNGFDKWIEATNMFVSLSNQFPSRVRLVEYSELIRDPVKISSSLFDFAQIPMESQTTEFISESVSRQNDSHYSVFRNNQIDDGWKNRLDPAIAEQIISETEAAGLGRFL